VCCEFIFYTLFDHCICCSCVFTRSVFFALEYVCYGHLDLLLVVSSLCCCDVSESILGQLLSIVKDETVVNEVSQLAFQLLFLITKVVTVP